MGLSTNYDPDVVEKRLLEFWQQGGYTNFDTQSTKQFFTIDTPPPTVSGRLHLGHVYSYTHIDFIARYRRMRGYNVYFPMGFDDNGLPTERLVEKQTGWKPGQSERAAFRQKCAEVSVQAEEDYRALWQRLGLSVDWRFSYRTIDQRSQRHAQQSFIDLYEKGKIYRSRAPVIWCPECRTAIAQAELNDLERMTESITIPFRWLDEPTARPHNGPGLKISTTRPELLPACVAVFVHPSDPRYIELHHQQVRVPIFDRIVPILPDAAVNPEKGTGAVMCCTFGDSTDIAWWRTHQLPLIEVILPDGSLSSTAGPLAGLPVETARRQMKQILEENSLILERSEVLQSIHLHERCERPIEYIVAPQWFVQILDIKDDLLKAGEIIAWYPDHMRARYLDWVQNLNWDWCISRQRLYGVPFPVWYCLDCGEIRLADTRQLPIDPALSLPEEPCHCGSTRVQADNDVMDTWATSSLSPQITGELLLDGFQGDLPQDVFPFSLRPQAHEIIRTWAFYTIVKSFYSQNQIPWESVLISGWGLAGQGMGKISKSKGSGGLSPIDIIKRYSADAARYWAASTGPGKDTYISEEKFQMGAKLVTKLWNVARFSERFLQGIVEENPSTPVQYTPADRWILASLQATLRRASAALESYDYAAAKREAESFFWNNLADNYLEMCKSRLYAGSGPQFLAARASLSAVLLAVLKLFAPFLPYVTEEIFQALFSIQEGSPSIHVSGWPEPDTSWEDQAAEEFGETLVGIASAVRRYKSTHNLPLATPLRLLQLATGNGGADHASRIQTALPDLKSITRAQTIEVVKILDAGIIKLDGELAVAIGIAIE